MHPGQVLKEIYMAEMAISPDFAIILEATLGTSASIWVRMQAEYDLWEARKKAA